MCGGRSAIKKCYERACGVRDMSESSEKTESVVFRVESLCKHYVMGEITVSALRNISLNVFEGEFLVILGPSGSGKSTLVNIIGGIDTPTSRRVTKEHDVLVSLMVRQYLGISAYTDLDKAGRLLDEPFVMNAGLIRARLRPVKIGIKNDQWAEVLEGLEAQDRVIAETKNELNDAVRVVGLYE